MNKLYRWELKDIVLVGLTSIIFGIIYLGAVYAGVWLSSVLTPFGLSVFGNEIIFGIWFMAPAFITYIIQKPGVATISEMLAALIEVFLGNFYGPIVFVSGFVQGIGTEFGFAITKYRNISTKNLVYAAIGCTITSFIWGVVRNNFADLNMMMLVAIFAVRLVSALFFSCFLVKQILNKVEASGVLKNYNIALEDGLSVSNH